MPAPTRRFLRGAVERNKTTRTFYNSSLAFTVLFVGHIQCVTSPTAIDEGCTVNPYGIRGVLSDGTGVCVGDSTVSDEIIVSSFLKAA